VIGRLGVVSQTQTHQVNIPVQRRLIPERRARAADGERVADLIWRVVVIHPCAAGPATFDAANAPNSQPDPMIEPTEVNSSPTLPTSRRSFRCAPGAAATLALSTKIPLLLRRRLAQADDSREPTAPEAADAKTLGGMR
jgi:hypothetical protein